MAENTGIQGSFELKDREYRTLASLVFNCAGIDLGDTKRELVHARLGKVLRKRGISGFGEYIRLLEKDSTGDELVNLLDAIATNVTHFFREEAHFAFIAENLPPRTENGGLRVWSAGCSSGEEPYSIGITLLEHVVKPGGPMPQIKATDISTKILKRAIGATYPLSAVKNLDKDIVRKYFLRGKNNADGLVKVKRNVADLVTFERLNLIEDFSFRNGFDTIFCRNVMIYFNSRTREEIVNKFARALNPGGYLIIGHSESLNGINHPFQYIKPTIYRKKA